MKTSANQTNQSYINKDASKFVYFSIRCTFSIKFNRNIRQMKSSKRLKKKPSTTSDICLIVHDSMLLHTKHHNLVAQPEESLVELTPTELANAARRLLPVTTTRGCLWFSYWTAPTGFHSPYGAAAPSTSTSAWWRERGPSFAARRPPSCAPSKGSAACPAIGRPTPPNPDCGDCQRL